QYAGALPGQRGEQRHDLRGQGGVEVAGGFVGHQQARLGDDRPRDADALLFARRQLAGQGIAARTQAQALQHRAYPPAGVAAAHAAQHQRQGDVVVHAAVGKQAVVLEHDADLAPVQGDAATADLEQVALAEQHRAAAGPLGQVDEPEQGALAGAGMPGDEEHFTGVNAEADAIQRDVAAWILLADVVEAQDLRHRKTRVVWRHEYRLMAALRPDARIRSGDRTGSVLRARPALDQLAQALADAAEQRRLLRRCGRRGHPRLLAGGRRGHRLGLLLRLRLRPGPRCTRRRGAGFGAALRRPAFVLPAAFDLLALGVDATPAATTTTLARCALSVGAGDFSRSGGSRRGGCRRRWRRHVRGGRIIGRGHVRTRLARLARTALGPTLGAAARTA